MAGRCRTGRPALEPFMFRWAPQGGGNSGAILGRFSEGGGSLRRPRQLPNAGGLFVRKAKSYDWPPLRSGGRLSPRDANLRPRKTPGEPNGPPKLTRGSRGRPPPHKPLYIRTFRDSFYRKGHPAGVRQGGPPEGVTPVAGGGRGVGTPFRPPPGGGKPYLPNHWEKIYDTYKRRRTCDVLLSLASRNRGCERARGGTAGEVGQCCMYFPRFPAAAI